MSSDAAAHVQCPIETLFYSAQRYNAAPFEVTVICSMASELGMYLEI